MKVRIHRDNVDLYYGQVYDKEIDYWQTVTNLCLTKRGAKRELKEWLRDNDLDKDEEFEI